jgi:hypothetical protein
MAVDDRLDLSVALRRDNSDGALGLEIDEDGIGAVDLVAEQGFGLGPR